MRCLSVAIACATLAGLAVQPGLSQAFAPVALDQRPDDVPEEQEDPHRGDER